MVCKPLSNMLPGLRSRAYGILFPMLVMLLVPLFAVGCSATHDILVGEEVELERGTFTDSSNMEHPYNLFTEYHILPGDVLDVLFQIRTWSKKNEFKLDVDHTLKVKFVSAPELDQE